MRGGTQSHLLAASDGQYYVVKFSNNPLGSRVLVNEVICSRLLRALGIRVPETACIRIPDALAQHPEVGIRRGDRMDRPRPGLHFASALPCDPRRSSIFDFVPHSIVASIENAEDFVGALVADLWLGNADMRQAVYYRSSAGRWQATFIDHGMCFGGPDWQLYISSARTPSPEQRYHLQSAAESDCLPWLEKIRALPGDLFEALLEEIPAEWLASGDTLELQRLLSRLNREREFLHHRIAQALLCAKNYRREPARMVAPPCVRSSLTAAAQFGADERLDGCRYQGSGGRDHACNRQSAQ
jgi:hypothetical protein